MIFSKAQIDRIPRQISPGSMLWEYKHDKVKFKVLESGDPYTASAQLQQNPSVIGGGMFKDKYWKHYDILPSDIDMGRIYGDTAQKIKENNDFSVLQYWVRSPTTGIYLVDQVRGKWEAPELETMLIEFWNKHKPTMYKLIGAQCVKIEDKSSGSSLIQSIRKDALIPIEPIQRNTDKFFRAMGVVKYFANGYVHLPNTVDWVHDYKDEFRKFSPLMTHKHDDQIDPTMDAVEDLIIFEDAQYNERALS